MIETIRQFFSEFVLTEERDVERADPISVAAAALLIEVARADYAEDPRELREVREALDKAFELDPEELDRIIEMAELEVREATSAYQFTRLINDHFDEGRKRKLIGAMWKVAFADGRLDKYEEHLIRRIAELIYVPHQEFIRLKLEANERL